MFARGLLVVASVMACSAPSRVPDRSLPSNSVAGAPDAIDPSLGRLALLQGCWSYRTCGSSLCWSYRTCGSSLWMCWERSDHTWIGRLWSGPRGSNMIAFFRIASDGETLRLHVTGKLGYWFGGPNETELAVLHDGYVLFDSDFIMLEVRRGESSSELRLRPRGNEYPYRLMHRN